VEFDVEGLNKVILRYRKCLEHGDY